MSKTALVRSRNISMWRGRGTIRKSKRPLPAWLKRHIGALLVGGDPLFSNRRERIVDLAQRYRLPAIYEWRTFVDAEGLMSYGSSLTVYAGKVLAGIKPADLPVQQPTHFELVINLKTAKALGFTVPLLAQADEVVE